MAAAQHDDQQERAEHKHAAGNSERELVARHLRRQPRRRIVRTGAKHAARVVGGKGREDRQPERATDLLRGVEQPRRGPGVRLDPTPEVASSVIGTNVSPIPIDIGTRPTSRFDDVVTVDRHAGQDNIPAAASVIPPTATVRTPKRPISCWARPAPTMIPSVTGRNAKPAFSGL